MKDECNEKRAGRGEKWKGEGLSSKEISPRLIKSFYLGVTDAQWPGVKWWRIRMLLTSITEL